MPNSANLRALSRLTAFSLIFVLLAPAQSPPQNWNAVQMLPVGADLRVNLNGRSIRGRFQSASDDSLIIDSDKGHEMLMRLDVVRVSVKGKGHRGRNALIGLAAGAGAGAVIGAATANSSCTGFCISPVSKGELVGILVGVLGIVGAVVGAVIPSGGWHEVYTR